MSLYYNNEKESVNVGAIIGTVVLLALFFIAIDPARQIYNRYQLRQDTNLQRELAKLNAENEVSLNEIKIKQQEQLIQVEKQKAEIRIVEAGGIAESQKIIASSLTNNYLQYLAIQAQETMAGSPNHTQIYIPVGTNGIPLIKTVD